MYYCTILTLLVASVQSAKILGVFMYPSFSHQAVYKKICQELSLRHHVTIVTPNPSNDPTLTNLTEIDVTFLYDVLNQKNVQKEYSKDISASDALKNIYKISDLVANFGLESTQFQTLILDKSQNFDLILIHALHPVLFALAGRYKAPVISVATLDPFISDYDSVGNPNHPVLYPEYYFTFPPGSPSFWEKLKSVYFSVWQKFFHGWVFLPRTDQTSKKHFGEGPYIEDLVKKVAMLFVYRSILLKPPKPNLPGVLDISFINTVPPKPLPDDLQKILDEAKSGVIYISFGSNIRITRFGTTLRNCILEAISELSYTVLLKWDSDSSPVNATNIVVRKWFPQKALLAHSNVRVFVTQGGLQSIEEAILGAVPLIGVPLINDQPRNVRRLVELGIGEEIDANNLSKSGLKNLIIKVAEDISYKEKIKTVRSTVLDKSMTGLENAIWWCEYVIRHKGAKHLRSSAVDMFYSHYFLSDIGLVLISILILSVLIQFKILHNSKFFFAKP